MANYSDHILSEFWDDFNAGAPDPIDGDQFIAGPIRRYTSSFQVPTPELARERARQRLFGSLLEAEENTMSANAPVVPFPGAENRSTPDTRSWLPDLFNRRADRRWAVLSVAAAVLILLAGVGSYLTFINDPEESQVIPAVIQDEGTPEASTMPATSPIAGSEKPEVMLSGAISGGVWTFDAPYDVDFDVQGNLYVPDSGTNRIIKIAPGGELLDFIGDGSGPGQLDTPASVMVDADGNLYVGNAGIDYVVKFNASGNFLLRWGGTGSGEGQFCGGPGVGGIDSQGRIWVNDYCNHRVQVFDDQGTFLFTFGEEGEGDGQLNLPQQLALDPDGNVYVAECGNFRVSKFSSDGTFLFSWQHDFGCLTDIDADPFGHILVADVDHQRIQVFDTEGNFLTMFGSAGTGLDDFVHPVSVSTDADGIVWVADHAANRLIRFELPPELSGDQ